MRVISPVPAILLALFISPAPGFAAGAKKGPDVSEICKHMKCRRPGTYKLRTDKGEEELDNFGLPYVYQGHVYVLPGDEFDIEIDFPKAGKATVALPGDPPRPTHTIHIKFTQFDGKQDMTLSVGNGESLKVNKDDMLLSLENKSGATVKYDAYMTLPDGRNLYTTSCPLVPGQKVIEHWPHAIVRLRLTNFRTQATPKESESGVITLTCD